MLDKDLHIKELYDLKHINDNESHKGFDYEENLMNRTLSTVMFKNPTTSDFITKLKDLLVLTIESNLIMRNFFNYTVPKYYNRHNN